MPRILHDNATLDVSKDQFPDTINQSNNCRGGRQITPGVAALLGYLTGRSGLTASPAEVRACIDSLTEQELCEFDQGFFYLNMLSVFGGRFAPESVRALANAAARERMWSNWECARYTAWIDGCPTNVALEGWAPDKIKRLLNQRKGLIICAAHIGPYRLIPVDLALLGYRVCMAVDKTAASCYTNLLSAQGADPAAVREGSLYVCDVEHNPAAPFLLKAALQRNEIVVFWVDGNLGLDGLRGSRNKCQVQFLNEEISVKSGVAQLAAGLATPLQCVFSIKTGSGFGSVICPDEIIPSASMTREARQEFAAQWIQTFYQQLEKLVLQYPQQWESVRFLHRWRNIPPPAEDPEPNAANIVELETLLQRGCLLRLDKQRVAAFENQGRLTLVDVRTLNGYEVGTDLQWVYQSLSDSGISKDCAQLETGDMPNRNTAIKLLDLLYNRGLLQVTRSK